MQILIVENIPSIVDGIKYKLEQQEHINKVFWSKNDTETYSILNSENIDLVILDLNLDTKNYDIQKFQGLAIAKEIKNRFPEVKILVFTEYIRSELYISLSQSCNIEGYLDKRNEGEELLHAIETIMNGEPYIDNILKSILTIGNKLKVTNREYEVAELIVKGKKYQQIAEELFISLKTVESHVANLKKKY